MSEPPVWAKQGVHRSQLTTSSSVHEPISKEGSSCMGNTNAVKNKSNIIIVFLVYPLSSHVRLWLLLWLGSSYRLGWMESTSPDLMGNFSVLQALCPQKPTTGTSFSGTIPCTWWAVATVPEILRLSSLGTGHTHLPQRGLAVKEFLTFATYQSLPWNSQSTWGSCGY